jgi:hypothetical protein
MKNQIKIMIMAIVAVAFVISGCSLGGDKPDEDKLGNVPATGVTLNKNSTSIMVGGSEQLTAVISPANATNQDVAWSSSDNGKAIVSANGLVTAVAKGTAIITVTAVDCGIKSVCTVEVTEPGGPGMKIFCGNNTTLDYTFSVFDLDDIPRISREMTVKFAIYNSGDADLVLNGNMVEVKLGPDYIADASSDYPLDLQGLAQVIPAGQKSFFTIRFVSRFSTGQIIKARVRIFANGGMDRFFDIQCTDRQVYTTTFISDGNIMCWVNTILHIEGCGGGGGGGGAGFSFSYMGSWGYGGGGGGGGAGYFKVQSVSVLPGNVIICVGKGGSGGIGAGKSGDIDGGSGGMGGMTIVKTNQNWYKVDGGWGGNGGGHMINKGQGVPGIGGSGDPNGTDGSGMGGGAGGIRGGWGNGGAGATSPLSGADPISAPDGQNGVPGYVKITWTDFAKP